MERIWLFTYYLASDNKSVCTIKMIASSYFNEKGKYTEEDLLKLHKIIKDNPFSGDLKLWDEYANDINLKIKEVIKEDGENL